MTKSNLRLLLTILAALALASCESRTGEIMETTDTAPAAVHANGSGHAGATMSGGATTPGR